MSESYTTGGNAVAAVKRNNWAAQTFTPIHDHLIKWVRLKVYARPVNLGCYLDIRTTDNGYPTNTILAQSGVTLDLCYPYPLGKLRTLTLDKNPLVLAGTTYAIVLRNKNMRWVDRLNWVYHYMTAAYPRGMRLFSANEGDTWKKYPLDDQMFTEWGDPPTPVTPPDLPPTPTPEQPDLPVEPFAILDVQHTITREGYQFIVTTNMPCHLYMYWTTTETQKHTTAILRRGEYWKDALRYCFVNYHENEQEEPGDTLFHTFLKEPWAHCETRYFTFRAKIDELFSPSSTPIFIKHRQLPEWWQIIDEPWTLTYPVPPLTSVLDEPWSDLMPSPTYLPVLLEPWTTPPAPEIKTLEIKLSSDIDECGVYHNGESFIFYWPHVGLIVGYDRPDGYRLGVGLRFLNIPIPAGSTIHHAYLVLKTLETNHSYGVATEILGELSPNPLPFIDLADFQARTPSLIDIDWVPIEPWTGGVEYTSPDIMLVIQELIDQPGWSSGNPLVLFWGDFKNLSLQIPHTSRMAVSHEWNPNFAPILKIYYTEP